MEWSPFQPLKSKLQLLPSNCPGAIAHKQDLAGVGSGNARGWGRGLRFAVLLGLRKTFKISQNPRRMETHFLIGLIVLDPNCWCKTGALWNHVVVSVEEVINNGIVFCQEKTSKTEKNRKKQKKTKNTRRRKRAGKRRKGMGKRRKNPDSKMISP